MMKVRKAVIPAAGFGTRFLPFSKSVPKEMIPLVDKPVLQYVLEEAADSGIEEVLLVISEGKESIRHFLEPAKDLEERLRSRNRLNELAGVASLMEKLKFSYVFQEELNGLGGAVACAEQFVGDEPFAIMNGDTVMRTDTSTPVLAQLLEIHERFGGTVMALEKIPPERVSKYGIAGGKEVEPGVIRVEQMVEKPSPEEAPSNLAIAARYVYTPEIFDCIARTAPGKSGEIQLPDATVKLLAMGLPVSGRVFAGKRYDIGDKLSFLESTVEFGLRRPEFFAKFSQFICETAEKIKEGKNV